MIRFKSSLPLRSPLFAFALLLILSTLSLIAASPARSAQPATQSKDLAHSKDYVPHGRVIRLARDDLSYPIAAQKHDTVTCSLRKGETAFVISLPKTSAVDKLTF